MSDLGRVRKAWPGARKPLILSQHAKSARDKGPFVELYVGRRPKVCAVLRLVAEAFLGVPEGAVVIHKNGLHSDNRLENVALMSRERMGRKVNRRWRARPVVMIDRDGEIVECYGSAREAARAGHMHKGCVLRRCNRSVADEFALTGYSYRWDDGL